MEEYAVLRLPGDALATLLKGGSVLLVHQNRIVGRAEALHEFVEFPRPATDGAVVAAWREAASGVWED